MPHEHVNSTSEGDVPEPNRIVVIWSKGHGAPHAYADPQDGYVQVMSEFPHSAARFPSPRVVELDPDAPHAFSPLDVEDNVIRHPRTGVDHCRWCDRTKADGPHGVIDPDRPHRFRLDVNAAQGRPCVHCGRSIDDGKVHVGAGALIDPDDPHRFVPDESQLRDVASDVDPRDPGALDAHGQVIRCATCTQPRAVGNHLLDVVTHVGAWDDQALRAERARNLGTPLPVVDTRTEVRKVVYTDGEPTWSEPCTGFAVTLLRSDINRLIKMLRRARDEAYGADA